MEAFERFSQRVEQHYREPVNGQFEDGTKEVLPGEEIENSSDENRHLTSCHFNFAIFFLDHREIRVPRKSYVIR